MPAHITHPTRSWLFTPGTRADRFAKAVEVGADILIIDLEDAVSAADKPLARTTALGWLKNRSSDQGIGHALRINGLDTIAGIDDLQALLADGVALDYLVLPKTESDGHVLVLDRLLAAAGKPTRLIGLIESVRGIQAVERIAGASPRLAGLMLGAADMAADLGCATEWEPLAATRSRLVTACARAGVIAIDSPFFDVRDTDGCKVEAARAISHGFTAKAAVHPDQVGPINAALTPTDEQVAKARRILTENDKGVGIIDGQMIDEAVARKARRIVAAVGG